MTLSEKLAGYFKRLRYETKVLLQYYRELRTKHVFSNWEHSFSSSNAELLIGGNLDPQGGVRNHIHAIAKYTSMRAMLVPTDNTTSRFGINWFSENEHLFARLPPPPKTRACHTHVAPWFIQWCFDNRSHFRWIHTHHAWYHEETNPGGLTDWQKQINDAGLFALQNCDHPLVVSRWQQSYLRNRFSIAATYLPNGVDTRKCENARPFRFRKKFRIKHSFILWLGRNETVKNPKELLEAAAHLPHLMFVMAGQGCNVTNLERTLNDNLPKNVIALGALSEKDAQDAIAACAALVVTSKKEGLPTIILEAMIHRKIIVSSDAEGCLDALGDGKYGLVYTRGNIQQLCECLLATSCSKLDVNKASHFARSEFGWGNLIGKLDSIYNPEKIVTIRT